MTTVFETFITQDEIELITGYKRPLEQRKWLDANGWQFELNRAGRPVILREVMNHRFGIIKKTEQIDKKQSFILDISKVK